jgi:hypothetical protein
MNFDTAVQALCDAGVEFVIIGGWSAILHGSGVVEIHLRRAAPRTLSAVCARSCNRRTRSPGSRRNCSINSVISTPNFFAAAMRPPRRRIPQPGCGESELIGR